jgi:hypothetical protein
MYMYRFCGKLGVVGKEYIVIKKTPKNYVYLRQGDCGGRENPPVGQVKYPMLCRINQPNRVALIKAINSWLYTCEHQIYFQHQIYIHTFS